MSEQIDLLRHAVPLRFLVFEQDRGEELLVQLDVIHLHTIVMTGIDPVAHSLADTIIPFARELLLLGGSCGAEGSEPVATTFLIDHQGL